MIFTTKTVTGNPTVIAIRLPGLIQTPILFFPKYVLPPGQKMQKIYVNLKKNHVTFRMYMYNTDTDIKWHPYKETIASFSTGDVDVQGGPLHSFMNLQGHVAKIIDFAILQLYSWQATNMTIYGVPCSKTKNKRRRTKISWLHCHGCI